jgi:hypothetical protein
MPKQQMINSESQNFWGLNQLALSDQKINKNQLTMMSGHLDQINGKIT